VLIGAGHEVRMVNDGGTVLETLHDYRPDAVLLDLGLPDMDGYSVAKGIRAEHRFDNVMLIAVSGYGRNEDIEAGRKAGIDQHLVKPVDPRMLEDLLSRLPGAPDK
jgi:DNA-binding response OmpR family regulator